MEEFLQDPKVPSFKDKILIGGPVIPRIDGSTDGIAYSDYAKVFTDVYGI